MELVVAMSLMGVVVGLTMPLFRAQLKTYEKDAGRLDAQANARYGISMIDRELRAAGVGLPDPQPLIILAAPNAITFNGDLVSRDSTDVSAVYYDPDVSASEVSSLTRNNQITLPLSGYLYPDTTYTQQGGAPSEAETISFWVAADPDPTANGLSALFRRVNNGPVAVIAKALKLNPGQPVFRYFKTDTLGSPVEIAQGNLPLFHFSKIHGSRTDTLNSALTDSIRSVRVHLNGVYIDRNGTTTTRSIDTSVRIMNSGLLKYHTCGEPPIFTSTVAATASNNPAPKVVLTWNRAADESAGENDVEVYALFRRLPSDANFGEPFASIAAGYATYTFTDTNVATGDQWVYGVVAQDCDGQSSTVQTTNTVTVP
jgi:hypothetical protein